MPGIRLCHNLIICFTVIYGLMSSCTGALKDNRDLNKTSEDAELGHDKFRSATKDGGTTSDNGDGSIPNDYPPQKKKPITALPKEEYSQTDGAIIATDVTGMHLHLPPGTTHVIPLGELRGTSRTPSIQYSRKGGLPPLSDEFRYTEQFELNGSREDMWDTIIPRLRVFFHFEDHSPQNRSLGLQDFYPNCVGISAPPVNGDRQSEDFYLAYKATVTGTTLTFVMPAYLLQSKITMQLGYNPHLGPADGPKIVPTKNPPITGAQLRPFD